MKFDISHFSVRTENNGVNQYDLVDYSIDSYSHNLTDSAFRLYVKKCKYIGVVPTLVARQSCDHISGSGHYRRARSENISSVPCRAPRL